MEDSMIERQSMMGFEEKIGGKRGRGGDEGKMGRLEKKPSGVVVLDDYDGEEMINGVKYEEEKEIGGGVLNPLMGSSPKGSGDHQAKSQDFGGGFLNQLKGSLGNSNPKDGGHQVKNQDSGGGVISNLVSNFFHHTETGGGGGEEEEKQSGGGGGGGDGEEKKEGEKDEGGSIIDDIVSHLPRTLSEDTAPPPDEASILIHSIIHD